ncbi:hypothetical protein J3R30DRAFT_3222543, partial [Lentinula aciculospora]
VQLSSVCRRWRSIVVGAPLFWNFFVSSSLSTIELAPLFFERSKSLPIDLIVAYFSSDKLSPLLSSEIGRIQSLDFRSIQLDELIDCLSIFSVNSATNLTQLKIRCSPKLGWHCYSSQEHYPLIKSAESLRSLVLKGVCSRLSPPMVNLTHLEIHGFSPTFTEFRSLFTSNPALSTLCLPRFLPTKWLDDEYCPIDAFSLRSFSVGLAMHWGPGTCNCMLTFLRMDNLEYLEIVGHPAGSISNHFSS